MNTRETHFRPMATVDLAGTNDFRLGNLLCQPSLLKVSVDTRFETLEPRMMQVLVALVRHQGEVVSRDQLVELCWGGRVVSDDAIHRCIGRLRKIAEELGGFELKTIRRVGYCLVPDAVPAEVSRPEVALSPIPPITQDTKPASWKTALPLAALVMVAVAAVGALQFRQAAPGAEQHAAVLAEITRLVGQDQYGAAFTLAAPLMQNPMSRSPELEKLWQEIVLPIAPLVDQKDARVWFKPYTDIDGQWVEAGTTPLSSPVDAPRGVLRIKVEKPGFRTSYFTIANPGPSSAGHSRAPLGVTDYQLVSLPLVADTALAQDMVQVPRTNMRVSLAGWTREPLGDFQHDVPAYAIGRREVTNLEFKEFVDAGGYSNAAWWQELEFQEEGRTLTWEEARARFVDATGRLGPAGWQLSTYPNGQAQMPVGGISWYEAMAYARFRGRMLPTIHHWVRAAFAPYEPGYSTAAMMAVHGRFSAAGPLPADDAANLGAWGTVNMAGNMREWVLNAADGEALALGGAWGDYTAQFQHTYAVSPMLRQPDHGLRLMEIPAGDDLDPALLDPVALVDPATNRARQPVSDEVFEGMRLQFSSLHAKPLSQSLTVIEESALWIAEEVVLSYEGGDTATLIVVRPRQGTQLQPIVFAPSQACCILKRANREVLENLDIAEFVVNSGRALILPIWAGSYERFLARELYLEEAIRDEQYRQLAFLYHQDISRAIDYLETRADMDADRVGYLGFSRGAHLIGPVVMAIEGRIKAAVWTSAGLPWRDQLHPMLDAVNYAPRITQPVLMLNGRFDHLYPEEVQRRLFDLLGTPASAKANLVFDAGHMNFPQNTLAREASDWFDKYLGPPRRD